MLEGDDVLTRDRASDRIAHEAPRGKEGGAPTGATGGLVRCEVKGTAAQHGSGDTSHQEGLRLDVEVSEHLVGAPATDHAETVAVDSGAKECHGAASACRARRDVVGRIRRIGMEGERGANAKREAPSRHILKRCGRG